MARGLRRLNSWALLSALLAAGAAVGWFVPPPVIDWQPALAWREPWRWWTAAFVHWSALHLAANAVGLALVAALGAAGRLPPRAALAWGVAWPLTQGLLLAQPALLAYGGLSGVLHAGVAVAAVFLLRSRVRIAVALLAGLAVKLALEAPWGPPLRHGSGWDFAVAPLAHATGCIAGLVCAAVSTTTIRR